MALAIGASFLLISSVLANPIDQHVLSSTHQTSEQTIEYHVPKQLKSPPQSRKIQGRFLHITDFHPDPFFKSNSATDNSCHSGKGSAGLLGAAASDCDSPVSLINATFQWIEDNIKDDIDFVIWTGDSARHDNDEDIPRTQEQVISLNELMVSKFEEVFGVDDTDPTSDFSIPIVPTFGNNDILPHNILEDGPNRWTRKYSSLWKKFIPEVQRHTFVRGGWFYTEVIPNKLAVFSLNTLYFFDSNSAVDGCDQKSEPGYHHFEWLRIQLQFLRDRGMKAIMTGHVPPARTNSKQSWDESCWQRYALWMRQYRDVVIGGMFGHMNIDHFMFQDAHEIEVIQLEDNESLQPRHHEPLFTIQSSANYLQELRQGWQDLPSPPSGSSYSSLHVEEPEQLQAKKKNNKNSKQEKREEFLSKIGGKWAERFSLTLVSPSIVPNYYPTLRIIEYNITGLEHETIPSSWREHVPPFDVQADMGDFLKQTDGDLFAVLSDTVDAEKKGKKKKKKGKDKDKKRKPKYKIPKSPSSTSPPGPGYSPQSLSLLSYTQYYANITKIDSDISAAASLEESQAAYNSKSKDGLVRDFFHFEIEYDTRNYSKRFEMEDLTVRSYLHLAKNIGKRKGNKAAGLDVDGPIWFEHEHNSAFEDEDVHHWSESQQQELIELEEGHSSTREAKALKPTPTAELDDEVVDRITNLESISPEDATVDIDKKHKKKKKKKHKKNEIWFTFLKRAFVGTKDDDELKDVFGSN